MQNYNVPYELQPLSMWSYFGYTILFSIPILGFICALVLSFSNSNINRRNFARSYFCSIIVAVVAVVVIIALGGTVGMLGLLS